MCVCWVHVKTRFNKCQAHIKFKLKNIKEEGARNCYAWLITRWSFNIVAVDFTMGLLCCYSLNC